MPDAGRCGHSGAKLWRAKFVMAGLVPAIHVFGATTKEDVDARVKPGHDEE
jgi:hypothetical protein